MGGPEWKKKMFKTVQKVAKEHGQKLNEETTINQEITQKRLYQYTNEILQNIKEVETKKKEINERAKE